MSTDKSVVVRAGGTTASGRATEATVESAFPIQNLSVMTRAIPPNTDTRNTHHSAVVRFTLPILAATKRNRKPIPQSNTERQLSPRFGVQENVPIDYRDVHISKGVSKKCQALLQRGGKKRYMAKIKSWSERIGYGNSRAKCLRLCLKIQNCVVR